MSNKDAKLQKQQYSKSAFVEEASDSKERLILQVLLTDDQKYTKTDVDKLVKEWKEKKINVKEEKEEKEGKA